jgi:hypothetical protein
MQKEFRLLDRLLRNTLVTTALQLIGLVTRGQAFYWFVLSCLASDISTRVYPEVSGLSR